MNIHKLILTNLLGQNSRKPGEASEAYKYTTNELRTQLTQKFGKNAGRASASGRRQVSVTNLSEGFTVIELLIATSVFSTVLLLGLTGFVQVGRSYYKGITITQTQQAAKQIMNEVSNNIRLSSSVSPLNTASAGRNYYCIGSHRYSFKLFNMVDSSNHDNSTKFGLLADQLTGNTACGNAFDAPVTALNNPTELLGNQMRLLSFSITPLSGSTTLYNVSIKVAYGQDSALTSASSPVAQCKLQLGGNQFCAITSLTTVVYQGI